LNLWRMPCVHVAIFTHADDLSGGSYRTLRILEEYPRGKYTLMMPRDAIERLRRDFGGIRVGRRTLSEILDGAIALRPLGRARGCDKGGDAEEEGVAAKLAPHAHRNGRGAPGSQHIKPPTSPRAEDEFWVYCY